MHIKIKGFQKTSLIDYPGKVCSVVFLAGCNLRCPFCQNPDLVLHHQKMKDIKTERVIEHISSNRKWIDGVCITGGEPTIYQDLPGFAQKIKKMGFFVKLDTNGTNPGMLDYMLKNCLVDYVSMDIKAPLESYNKSTNVEIDKEAIQKSVETIKGSGVDYEFRTTVVPSLFKTKDALMVGQWLEGSRKFAIQQFRPTVTLDKAYQRKKPYTEKRLNELKAIMEPFFESVEVRV